MAQGFQADSCSTTAQTSAGSSDCAKAALRASAMSWARNDNCREQAPASFSGKRGRSIKKTGQPEFIACRKRMRWGGGGCPTACGLLVASALAAGVEIDELDERRFVELNSLLCGDFFQRAVDVRQMISG